MASSSSSTNALSVILLISLILLSTTPNSVLGHKCPKDTLKFSVCGSFPGLGGVIGSGGVGIVVGGSGHYPGKECCSLVKGLVEMDAAVCLCSAMKANVLGMVKVDMSVALTGLLNGCGKKMPQGFVCA